MSLSKRSLPLIGGGLALIANSISKKVSKLSHRQCPNKRRSSCINKTFRVAIEWMNELIWPALRHCRIEKATFSILGFSPIYSCSNTIVTVSSVWLLRQSLSAIADISNNIRPTWLIYNISQDAITAAAALSQCVIYFTKVTVKQYLRQGFSTVCALRHFRFFFLLGEVT
jgi:hypothetical protein